MENPTKSMTGLAKMQHSVLTILYGNDSFRVTTCYRFPSSKYVISNTKSLKKNIIKSYDFGKDRHEGGAWGHQMVVKTHGFRIPPKSNQHSSIGTNYR